MKDISLLLPKVQVMAKTFIDKCNAQGIKVGITSTYRSIQEQDAIYAQGRTTAGQVITNARGGQSMHNYKVALDFCPMTADSNFAWNDKATFTKIGMIGESCGFEWGGRWVSFLDLPHLQYTAGYTLEDFQNGKVDYAKFDIAPHTPSKRDLAAFALRDWQVSLGIMDFAHETDPNKIKFGPKSQAAFNN